MSLLWNTLHSVNEIRMEGKHCPMIVKYILQQDKFPRKNYQHSKLNQIRQKFVTNAPEQPKLKRGGFIVSFEYVFLRSIMANFFHYLEDFWP